MYRVTNPPSEAGQIAHLILAQCQELAKAVSLLQKNGDVLGHCVEINRSGERSGPGFTRGDCTAFRSGKDPITLIKIKELIEFLETATDRAEDVADVLETVVLKNA